MTFGTSGPGSSPWLYPDTYTDWGATGTGAAAATTLTFESIKVSDPRVIFVGLNLK